MLCPPDEFRAELRDSLTAFYENILKKSCAGGHPAAKPLPHKFVTKTAPVPDPPVPIADPSDDANADANAVKPPSDAAAAPAPPPAPAVEAEAASPKTPALPTPPRQKGQER